mmetsp:Transcript_12613/g.27388  ORF Transcript_12613/g.27388 Transcript_12613/m.27388 type:complete len:88 (-) Transcript_12613:3020-3283(-)
MVCVCSSYLIAIIFPRITNTFHANRSKGIHGNENTNIKIADVEFRDFEVAAVSLNNVDNLEISGCNVVKNRHDVPIVGLFSAARFIR